MIWIIVILMVMIALVYYTGNFIPHQTTICLTEVNHEIEQCFAFACHTSSLAEKLAGVNGIELNEGTVKGVGDRGIIITDQGTRTFEISDFIPNYRVSAIIEEDNEKRKIQLSFYKLSRNNTRVVWIDRVESRSNFKRVWIAMQKKQREQNIQRILDTAKNQLEKMDEVLTPYADVSPEENPNFTLK